MHTGKIQIIDPALLAFCLIGADEVPAADDRPMTPTVEVTVERAIY